MSKSRIFLILCLSFIFGIFLNSFFGVPQFIWPGILLLGIILISVWWRNRKIKIISFCLLFLVAGIYRGNFPEIRFRYSFAPLKEKAESAIKDILPEPQSSFLAGLLLGSKEDLAKDLLQAFNITGTRHIIALSGYNITIVAGMIMSFLGLLTVSRKWSFWLATLGILFFVLLTGASSSVVRAAIMGILVLVAMRAGRLSNIRNAIVLAGLLMLLKNPSALKTDIGFQLSFAATLGLIYISPYFKKLPEVLAMTISAQMAAVPLVVYHFGQLSLIAPLANALILPVIPLTMLLGFIASLVGFLFVPLAQILAWPAWLFLTYEIKITEMFSKIPYAFLSIENLSIVWLIGYYVILISGFLFFRLRRPAADIAINAGVADRTMGQCHTAKRPVSNVGNETKSKARFNVGIGTTKHEKN